jgi:DNA-binding sugar fermentation-stimulating protein
MVNFQILALLAIVFCFTLQSEASPLTLREVETDGEETDREFEDAFEAAMKEEVKREFQFENAHEARSFDEDEEVARTLQDQSSFLDDLQEKAVGKETDRQFENAFDEALNEEMVRIFEDEEEMDVRVSCTLS